MKYTSSPLLQRMPKSATCAEIGVWQGEFSVQILQVTMPAKLHLIDPWIFQPEYPNRWYGGRRARSQICMDDIYRSVSAFFRESQGVVIHRGFSEEVLPEFDDHYFDWIYIDGNHSYQYVRKDLELSFLKVKPGGFIAGDDYHWGADEGLPVRNAVHDFIDAKRLTDNLELIDGQFLISLPYDDS